MMIFVTRASLDGAHTANTATAHAASGARRNLGCLAGMFDIPI
jgi:hypothetical protein